MGILHCKTFLLVPLSCHNKEQTLADLEQTPGKGIDIVEQTSDLSLPGKIETPYSDLLYCCRGMEVDPRAVLFVDQIFPESFWQGVRDLFTEILA
jgi:hypothetical protein